MSIYLAYLVSICLVALLSVCASLFTLLLPQPPYSPATLRHLLYTCLGTYVSALLYLLYMPAYAPYSVCLLVCGIRRVVTTTLYAIERHREHEEREMRQKVVCVSLLAIEGRVSLSPCHRAVYGIE